ncbi:MFS general substrate transporter [Pluteus cervinus]|uniref:MFS general substrate transporter n=1 Tax=Pluteus cervinus TaxID=181527 RepID=A0ACD3A9M7_9AGAR|nr:MFS general substrate transporter [Pluteus cervinus]
MSSLEKCYSRSDSTLCTDSESEIDIYTYHEQRSGRLVLDPAEAKIEFGESVALRLKLSEDGSKILWPQPTDSPDDPQNWSSRRKAWQLLVITLTSVCPEFNAGIGIPAIFGLAKEYRTTTAIINNLTSNWSIFLLGWGGIFGVMLSRKYGRLPVLFWSQVLGFAFMCGATFAPNLPIFTAMRCLTAFFGTVPQVTGLYVVTDMYPFHLQARKLNLWTLGFVISPFLSPFACGYLVAKADWRWSYAVGAIYNGLICLLIMCFMEETMYDRSLQTVASKPTSTIRYRLETLIGITGYKMAKYRSSWSEVVMAPLRAVWRPHLLGILIFEACLFGLGIGINVTNIVFLENAPFHFSPYAIAGVYATPIVAAIIGELLGRYLNDWIMNIYIRRNNGVFEAEARLWSCHVAVLLNTCGLLMLGASIQLNLHIAVLVIGWGLTGIGIMIGTVSVYSYCSDCFPKHQGEISALLTLARVLGGFSVAYYQVPWAEKRGALETFGVEAGIVVLLFVLIIPLIQIKGRWMRERFLL